MDRRRKKDKTRNKMNLVIVITTRKIYLPCFKFTEHWKKQHTYNTKPRLLLLHLSPPSWRGEALVCLHRIEGQSIVTQGRSTNDFDRRDRIQHIPRFRIHRRVIK